MYLNLKSLIPTALEGLIWSIPAAQTIETLPYMWNLTNTWAQWGCWPQHKEWASSRKACVHGPYGPVSIRRGNQASYLTSRDINKCICGGRFL